MRIAVVGPLPPLRGGISQYNESLISTLERKGHDVLPVSYKKLYPARLFPGTNEFIEDGRIYPGSIRNLIAWNPLTWVSSGREIKKFRVDILVLHLWHPFFAPCLRYLQQMVHKRKIIVIAHNVLPHEHQKVGKILNGSVFRRSGKVLVGGTSEKDKLNVLVPSADCEVAPHPVYDRFHPGEHTKPKNCYKEKLDVASATCLLVNVGLIRKYKGVDLLLKAFSAIEDENARLVIAGEFYDDFQHYKTIVDSSPNSERILIINRFLSDEEMSDYLHAADAVILPYRNATQSGAAMAALACGTPVIASNVGALKDVIEPGVLGYLVTPENVAELSKMLDTFIQDWKQGKRLDSDVILQRVREKFSWDSLVAKITGVVE